jgi:uncharacterized delta-60 repeat protein
MNANSTRKGMLPFIAGISILVGLSLSFQSLHSQSVGLYPGFGVNGAKTNKIQEAVGLRRVETSQILSNENADTYSTVYIDGNLVMYKRSGDGYPVTNYGTNGYSDYFPIFNQEAVLLPGGEIIIAGYIWEGGSQRVALAKLDKYGKYALSFGNKGLLITDFVPISSNPLRIVVLASGRILVFSHSYNDPALSVLAFTAAGKTDYGYGKQGVLQIATGYEEISSIVVTKLMNNKIMLGHSVRQLTANTDSKILIRLTANGYLDAGFGSNGILDLHEPNTTTRIAGIGEKPDRGLKLLYEDNSNYYFTYRVIHLKSNGQPDPAFDWSQYKIIDFSFTARALTTIFQQDGKIVLLVISNTSTIDYAIAKINSDSEPDLSFNGTGSFKLDRIPNSSYSSIALTPRKNVMVIGNSYSSESPFFLFKITDAGIYDNYYGTNGMVSGTYIPSDFQWTTLVKQQNGKLITGGSVQLASGFYWVMAGFSKNGRTDNSFGKEGFSFTKLTEGQTHQASMIILPDNKVLLYSFVSGNSSQIILWRFTADGKPDVSWGSNGKKIIQVDNQVRNLIVQVQPDKKLLIGYPMSITAAPGDENAWNYGDIVVQRLTAFGEDDRTFEKRVIDFDASGDNIFLFKLQPDGKIYLIGESSKFFAYRLAVMRLYPNGKTDNSYGTNGKFIHGTALTFHANDAEVVPGNKLIVAGRAQYNEYQPMAGVVKLTSNGQLDLNFADMGLFKEGFQVSRTEAQSMNIQKDGKIVLTAYDYGNFLETAIIRLNPDGSRDIAFGPQGIRRVSYSMGNDYFAASLLQDNLLIMAGSTAIPAPAGILAAVSLYSPNNKLAEAPSDPGIGLRKEAPEPGGLKLFPNPATTFVELTWKPGSTDEPAEIQLYDLQGRLLQNSNNLPQNGSLRLQTGQLIPGTYILTVKSKNGSFNQYKIIVGNH